MKKGFTLIEAVIYIALYSIVMVMFLNFFIIFLRNSQKSSITVEIQNNARFALSKIASEVKKAEKIEIPEADHNHTLKLNVTLLNEKGVYENKNIKYYVDHDKNRLYRMSGSTSNILSENIEDISFNFEKNSLLSITISSKYKGETYSISTSVFPRITHTYGESNNA